MKQHNLLLSLGVAILATNVQAAIPSWEALRTERVESEKDVKWTQISPGNAGYINLARYHPTIPGKVMLCPDMWSTYQSDDNGANWYSLTDCDGDASFYHLRDLYYSPSDPDFGVAVCSSELWITRNLGKNWEVVEDAPWNLEGKDRTIASVAIDPHNTDILFVGSGSNVRGQEWLSCYREISLKHPHGKSASIEGKIWRSTNGGKSWTEVSTGLNPKAQIGRIIVNPNNTKQIFASSNYGLYRSDDGGDSWSDIGDGVLDNNIIMDMDEYYNPKTKQFTIYLIDQVQHIPDGKTTRTTGGIFCSKDCGETWSKMNGNLALDLNRLSGGVPENYYLYLAKWLLDCELEDMPTQPRNEDVEAMMAKYPELPTEMLQPYWMISSDPSREDAVYVGIADPQIANSVMPGRLWVTTNGGDKWISTARLYPENWERDSEYWEERGNPWSPNMSVGHQSPHHRFGLNYSLRSMRGLDVGVDGSVMMISDHSTMLSTDNGASWHQVDETYTPSGALIGHGNSNMCVITTKQDKRTGTTIIGSNEHFVWIPEECEDGRVAIRQVNSTPETVRCIAYDPYDKNVAYATSARQNNKQYIFKSSDCGDTWARHGVATPGTDQWMDDFHTNSLLIDPINSQYFYHGITSIGFKDRVTEGGFYRSDDGGKSFQQHNNGLPEVSRVTRIVFDPRDKSNKSLFIAVEVYNVDWRGPRAPYGGLYHSSDRGDSWTKMEMPKPIEGIQHIAFDNTNRMYVTTATIGGGGGGMWYSDDFGTTWSQIFKEPTAEHIGISPFDHNLIAVSVCGGDGSLNPGFYLSRDRGKTWSKNNRNIVIPHQLTEITFDMFDSSKVWLGTYGAGVYLGEIEGGEQAHVVEVQPDAVEIRDGKSVKLSAEIVNSAYAGEKIVWNSENESIAKVNKKGVVTPVGRGSVKIWASTEDLRYTDYTVVTVF